MRTTWVRTLTTLAAACVLFAGRAVAQPRDSLLDIAPPMELDEPPAPYGLDAPQEYEPVPHYDSGPHYEPGPGMSPDGDWEFDPYGGPPWDEGPSEEPFVDSFEGGPGCDGCEAGCPQCMPLWYADTGLLLMSRSRGKDREFTFVDTTRLSGGVLVPTTVPVLGVSSIEFGFEPGNRTTLGRYLGTDEAGRDHFLEFTYFGINDWDESAREVGDTLTQTTMQDGVTTTFTFGSLRSIFQGPLKPFFDLATTQDLSYASDITNFELNLRIRRLPRLRQRLVLLPGGGWMPEEHRFGFSRTVLAGVRFISIEEDMRLRSTGQATITDNGVLTNDISQSGDYRVRTDNEMIGFQLGAEMTRDGTGWSIGMRGKAGLLLNFAEQITVASGQTFENLNQMVTQSFSGTVHSRSETLAVVGEFGAVGTYRILPNLSLRGAYDFMWVRSLALAPDQVMQDFRDLRNVADESFTFFHGGTVGFDFIW